MTVAFDTRLSAAKMNPPDSYIPVGRYRAVGPDPFGGIPPEDPQQITPPSAVIVSSKLLTVAAVLAATAPRSSPDHGPGELGGRYIFAPP